MWTACSRCAACGVPDALFRTVCASVDKLDKISWAEVSDEMVKKGLRTETAAKIGRYVKLSGAEDLIACFEADAKLCVDENTRGQLPLFTAIVKRVLQRSAYQQQYVQSVMSVTTVDEQQLQSLWWVSRVAVVAVYSAHFKVNLSSITCE